MGLWDVCSLEIGECEMLGIWDVRNVGCWRCGMFGMWDIWDIYGDVECWFTKYHCSGHFNQKISNSSNSKENVNLSHLS